MDTYSDGYFHVNTSSLADGVVCLNKHPINFFALEASEEIELFEDESILYPQTFMSYTTKPT